VTNADVFAEFCGPAPTNEVLFVPAFYRLQ